MDSPDYLAHPLQVFTGDLTAHPRRLVAFHEEDALSVLVADPLAVAKPPASGTGAAGLKQSPLAAGGVGHKSDLSRLSLPLAYQFSELLKLIIVDGTKCQFLIYIVWEVVEVDRLNELGRSLAAVLPIVQQPELREGMRPSLTVGGQARPFFFRGE